MGLLNGPVTFSRYRITGALPDSFLDFFKERILRDSFRTVWRTTDEKAAGWTALENDPDADPPYTSYAQERYILFSLRIDRKSIAPSLLRLRILGAERKQLAESGQKKLYREQREAIRESVRLDLLGKTLPVPSFHEICCSIPDRLVTFCCISDKVVGELQEMFRDSFSLGLSPYAPWHAADEGSEPQGSAAASDTPVIPHSPLPPEIDPLTVGREFLTWLWFKSEERNGMIRLSDGAECEVVFMRRLVLESGDGEYAETVVCQGLHAGLKEGKEALRQGKKISTARLRLALDGAEWEFTFKADRFHFQSMKLPAVGEKNGEETDQEGGEETDQEGQVLERIYLIEKAAGIMDQLFRSFLDLRLSSGWKSEQSRMRRWVVQTKAE